MNYSENKSKFNKIINSLLNPYFSSARKIQQSYRILYYCFFTGLDGSTMAQEREKLICQFNAVDNNRVWLFLLSTRYVSLWVGFFFAFWFFFDN
jgi:SNF2 family DNA or RNA helicase